MASNSFLDDEADVTWTDLSVDPDPVFAEYLNDEFGTDHRLMHSPYLTDTSEERALISTILLSLGEDAPPLSRRDGALFDYDNKRKTGYIVQSQMGTGKTTFIQHMIEAIDARERATGKKYRVVFFTNRISLATAQMEILRDHGVVCYKDIERSDEIPHTMRLIISMESVHRLQDRVHNMEMPIPDLIIWDEFTTGALHMVSDTIRNKDVLLNYIYELASAGMTTFMYLDAFFCKDGIDIIRGIHSKRDPVTKKDIARDRVFYLMNAYRPARSGLIGFHVEEANFTLAMTSKIDECINRWEDEIAASVDEERDPLFNDQLVCCFMSKAQLKSYVTMLKMRYPSVFSDRYIILIHSDCDAAALRTTHAATTEWSKAVAIFHTSSVLVGTNYNVRERMDVIQSRKRTRPRAGMPDEKAILDKVRIDVFCHGISDHPCAISMAQMMARTRYNGRTGMVHFLVPLDHRQPDMFPIEMEKLKAHLDDTRCYMNDPRLTNVSGMVRSTIVFNERTGEKHIAMVLQHNEPYARFYLYKTLCANRSRVSFLSHLKSILNGFSESVNALRVEDLAPIVSLGDDAALRSIERSNMKSRRESAKRGTESVRESYVDVLAKITARLSHTHPVETLDVLALYDMSNRQIEKRRTVNDVLCYDVLKFLIAFGIEQLPPRCDSAAYEALCDFIDEVHPWYANYYSVYCQAVDGSCTTDERLLEACRAGKLPDVEASHDVVRLNILMTSMNVLFPKLVTHARDGLKFTVPDRICDDTVFMSPARDVFVPDNISFHSIVLRDPSYVPIVQFAHQHNHVFLMLFQKLKNCPVSFSRRKIKTVDRAYINSAVDIVKFMCAVFGIELIHEPSRKLTREAVVAMGVDTTDIPTASDGRYSSTMYSSTEKAWNIHAACRMAKLAKDMKLRTGPERRASAMFNQFTLPFKKCKYYPLFLAGSTTLDGPVAAQIIEEITRE